ncbi:MAG: hypothetical protein GF308_02095 [Candidatus Heimdallarchaeota archaeon]|nr:hypothetical protein [Candidatus Heimdallarchaeota archaeon]
MNSKKFSSIVLLVLLPISMGCYEIVPLLPQPKAVAARNYPIEFYSGEQFLWAIDGAPNSTIEWWNSTSWTFVGRWQATTEDNIEFTVKGNTQINDQSYLVGQFNLGNLTITTNDHDIGTNLVLSAYPWVGGLIYAQQEWSGLTASPPFDESPGAELSEEELSILDQTVEAVKITYNDSFQQTELYYERITGILVRAETLAGQFSLAIHLQSSSIPLPSVTSGVGARGGTSLLLIMVIGVLFALRRTIRNKKKQLHSFKDGY